MSESPNLPKADTYRKGVGKNLSDGGKYETAGRYGGSVVGLLKECRGVFKKRINCTVLADRKWTISFSCVLLDELQIVGGAWLVWIV